MNWILVVTAIALTPYEAGVGPVEAGDHIVTMTKKVYGITERSCKKSAATAAEVIVESCKGNCAAITACIEFEPEGEAL